ncbi:hypothetical protein MNEG_15696, partial [Monoraphidium neglectum]
LADLLSGRLPAAPPLGPRLKAVAVSRLAQHLLRRAAAIEGGAPGGWMTLRDVTG